MQPPTSPLGFTALHQRQTGPAALQLGLGMAMIEAGTDDRCHYSLPGKILHADIRQHATHDTTYMSTHQLEHLP